jgi:hypothetical protein
MWMYEDVLSKKKTKKKKKLKEVKKQVNNNKMSVLWKIFASLELFLCCSVAREYVTCIVYGANKVQKFDQIFFLQYAEILLLTHLEKKKVSFIERFLQFSSRFSLLVWNAATENCVRVNNSWYLSSFSLFNIFLYSPKIYS